MGIVRPAEARQEKDVGPDEKAADHPRDRAAGIGLPPDETTEERRRHLRDGGEGEQSERGKPGADIGGAIIAVAEEEDDEDRRSADIEERTGHVLLERAAGAEPAAQEYRHDDVVRNHDRERDRSDDDHGGRCGEAADEGEKRDERHVAGKRQRQKIEIRIAGAGEGQDAGDRDRQDEGVDCDQIEREEDARRAQFVIGAVFHDRHVELPGKHDDAEGGKRDHQNPARDRRLVFERGEHRGTLLRFCPQICRPAEQEEDDIDAHREHRHELDDRFHRDREDQAVLVFRRIRVARTEDDRETGEKERDQKRQVDEVLARAYAVVAGVDHRGDRTRHRLELQCDIGNGPDERDQRDDCRNGRVLAVARSHEIGDGG